MDASTTRTLAAAAIVTISAALLGLAVWSLTANVVLGIAAGSAYLYAVADVMGQE